MYNSTDVQSCPLVDPLTWDPSFTNKAATISSVLAVVVQCLMIPFVIFFNAVTLVLVAKFEALHHKRFVVLGLLSVTDFLSGLVTQPLFAAKELSHLLNNEVNCELDSSFYLSSVLLSSASFYQLICLTYDRYVAITDPFQYPHRITITGLIYVAVANWAIHIILVIVFGTTLSMEYNIAIIALPILILFCILYWYIKVFKILKRHRHMMKAQQENVTRQFKLKRYLADRKSAITAVSLVGVFALGYFPVFIDIILGLYYGPEVRGPTYFGYHPWADLCLHSGSLFSPIVYGLRTSEFRRHIRKLFGIQPITDITPQPFAMAGVQRHYDLPIIIVTDETGSIVSHYNDVGSRRFNYGFEAQEQCALSANDSKAIQLQDSLDSTIDSQIR